MPILIKKTISIVLIAKNFSSFIEAIDELFLYTLAWMHGKLCLHYCYIVYVAIAYSATKKPQVFIELSADTKCSFIEALDKLFQHTLGIECMKHGLTTWVVCLIVL